MIRNQ